MGTILELANETGTSQFGSGVNKAQAYEANAIFEIKQQLANIRKFTARYEKTELAQVEMERYDPLTTTSGGDLEDGTDATWTVVDDQSLITFNTPLAISVGFKLTPKLVRQARTNSASFLARYRQEVALQLSLKEDVYVASVLIASTNIIYGGDATSDITVDTGDVMTVEMFETMVDDMIQNEFKPSDFLGTSKVLGQLRRDARLLNNSDFSIAIKEDGTTVTSVGDVVVHAIPGQTIFPNFTTAAGANKGTYGMLIDRTKAFGMVDFLKRAGANPITISTGNPDATLDGANYHRILGQEEVEAQILGANAIIVAHVSKE